MNYLPCFLLLGSHKYTVPYLQQSKHEYLVVFADQSSLPGIDPCLEIHLPTRRRKIFLILSAVLSLSQCQMFVSCVEQHAPKSQHIDRQRNYSCFQTSSLKGIPTLMLLRLPWTLLSYGLLYKEIGYWVLVMIQVSTATRIQLHNSLG